MKSRSTLNQLLKSLTAAVGLALFAYLFVFFAAEFTKIGPLRHSGRAHSAVRLIGDSTLVFSRVEPRDFLTQPVPREGDTVLTIADSIATRDRWANLLDSALPTWRKVAVEFRHDGQIVPAEILTWPPLVEMVALLTVLHALRFVIAMLFVSVALWALFTSPDSAGVRALALFSFAMAAFMISAVQTMPSRLGAFQIPYQDVIQEVLNDFSILFSAFWLNLAFLFPHPSRFITRRPTLAYALCYAPCAVPIAAVVLNLVKVSAVWLVPVMFVVIALQVFGGVAILVVHYRRAEDRLEKRQTRLVLWGTGVGLALLFVLLFVGQVFQRWFVASAVRLLILVNLSFLGLLLSPITFAYAFGRYRLLEVEGRLRRGTRHAIAIIVIAVALILLAVSGGAYLRRSLTEGNPWVVAVTLLVAVGVIPGLRGIQKVLERTFYPERQRLRDMFRDFLQRSLMVSDRRSFWEHLENRLQQGLMVDGVFPVLRKGQDAVFRWRDEESTPFHEQSDLVMRLGRDLRPLMVDEVLASSRVYLSAAESAWLTERGIALVLPLVAHSQLIGFLGLGPKLERDDFAAEELRILDSLGPQVALASENIRLLEENIEKRRMEEELQMAQRIQRGFLPREIPVTPGLELAARSRFCLEVAGDYYDIIPLDSGATVLAVGDVSGKGAAAALLMANLQASLRTAVGIGTGLSEVVSRINDLTFHNTPPEQYITFFVGVFDPARREFTYVNAGHNPPLLMRSRGEMETLDVGGIILGIFHGVSYEQATVALRPGDQILMYTDGVSEAMNGESEEFGEDRIRHVLVQNRSLEPPVLIERLESEVLHFHGEAPLEDDFTLLLARLS